MSTEDSARLEAATEGKYEILSIIGRGGMGVVYLARHRELGSHVAIKILPPEIGHSPTLLARFKREAALAARLSHPNIVPVFEFDVREGLAFLVMPYIEGVTLASRLQEKGPLDYGEVRKLVEHIGGALAFAHARGVVHRDVKPANILLERETGRWLVADFGIAHVATADETALTQTGAAIGTPAYMAPEQIGSAAEVDGRADLYSLAAVVFEALTGQPPEQQSDPVSLARMLHRSRPELPYSVTTALAAPLALIRDKRPYSVERWMEALKRRRKGQGRNVGVVVAAAMLVAVGGWWLGRQPGAIAETPVIAVLPIAVEGETPLIDLDSVLPQAFTWQLQMLPDYRVLPAPAIRSAIISRFGNAQLAMDTLLTLATDLSATQVVSGSARLDGDALLLRIEIYDAPRQRRLAAAEAVGPPDSLHSMVSDLIIRTVASNVARGRSGAESPTLPKGLPAISAYFHGDLAFRRGAYGEAVGYFDRVIEADSTYAPAHFKRMLSLTLQAQPTRASEQLWLALEAVERYRKGLDPVSARLLEGYAILLREGDVKGAAEVFRRLVDDSPDAVDAWFLLGFLQFRFPSILGTPITVAKSAFTEAVRRDPTFAAAVGNLVMIAALHEQDRETARDHMAHYLGLDSTSNMAHLVRVADTLLYRQERAPAVLSTFPSRPAEVLEFIALGSSELRPPGGTRPFATAAIEALLSRAATPDERTVYSRMRLADYLGSGQNDRAQRFLDQARRVGVPQAELDRWLVLSAVTPIPAIGTRAATSEAAARLLTTPDDGLVSRWLAARWYRGSGSQSEEEARRRFQEFRRREAARPLAASLALDLEALDRLEAGDTTQALATWERATERYNIDDLVFGLVSSLWPLKLERASIALAAGRYREAIDVTEQLTRTAGFSDQMAWSPALTTRAAAALAAGDTTLALNAHRDLMRAFARASGEGAKLRDSVLTFIEQLLN